ncbi:AraC family transcriptional regulator [Paenibacillus sp. GCM10027626]|uniref:helix-turn-helix transcriptional regulator n=1 Tax=Paenibacillus sp. GCM10027626 TaxID=3273411 RepID=UPI003631CB58
MDAGGQCPVFAVKECYAGTIVNAPGVTYGPRLQSELQLVLLHSGAMTITIDDAVTELAPGHMFLILPGQQVHIAFAVLEETWHRWITVFEYDIDHEVLEQLRGLPNKLPTSELMNQLLDALLGLQRRGMPGSGDVLNTLALAVFQQYAAECRNDAAALAVHPAVTLVRMIIQERFHEELALADLAAGGNVSVSQLVRLFRQHKGMTPMQFLWQYRMERGVELLRTTGLTVGEIAERCGFKSSYHFARIVKAGKGRTPTDIQRGRLQ